MKMLDFYVRGGPKICKISSRKAWENELEGMQARKRVAMRLGEAFWTANCGAATRGTTAWGPVEGGGGGEPPPGDW